MPNIKISELTAPIAVTDSDILPVVQSSVTRKITWGALKSTLAGALGRAYLGLGTASTSNVTTSATDTTAGRVLKVGDFGLGTDSQITAVGDLNGIRYGGIFSPVGQLNQPSGEIVLWSGGRSGGARAAQFALDLNGVSYARGYNAGRPPGAEWSPWATGWSSLSANAITLDTGSFGYGTGSGGTVTQATSKATAVTLNKPSGQITTAGSALAANTAVSFTLTNNKIAAHDLPEVVIKSGATAGAYVVQVDAVAAGSCRISIRNMTAGSLSETLVLQFNIGKGAIA